MSSPGRAFGALFVLGTLFVPYAQPVLCDGLMPAAMHEDAGHGAHDGHEAPAGPRIGSADLPSPCVPTCVAAHAGPLSEPVSLMVAVHDLAPAPITSATAVSAAPLPTSPPPRS